MLKQVRFAALVAAMGLLGVSATHAMAAADDPVTLKDEGERVTLVNGKVSVTLIKKTGAIPAMTLNGGPNLAGRGGYFAVVNSAGHDGWDIHNADYKVVRQSPELVELSFAAPVGGIHFDQHYILKRGDQGFYVFVQEHRGAGDVPEKLEQIRWSFYLNNALFNYQLSNDQEQGKIPDMRGGVQVQDATTRLPDGTVYTKYNYCDYLEGHYVHGMTGSGLGSYGAFVVQGSYEYLGPPNKQDIMVHAGPIIHEFLTSGHFWPRNLAAPPVPEGWSKACGPWFIFLTQGDTPQQMWGQAKAQAEKEKAQWPYQWMDHPDYPLKRGEVSGVLKLYDGSVPAAGALMVLTVPGSDWQAETLNYIFSTRADAQGKFVLTHVRPGKYTLFAAVPGVTDGFKKEGIKVAADGKVELGTVNFVPAYYAAKLWEIGVADLRTTGFKLADQPRQYGLNLQVPADLTYTIGTSRPEKDWYYAQAKAGTWDVKFDMDKTYGGQGVLTIGIAGQTNNPRLQVLVNGQAIGNVTTAGNSSALYRSAILGSSYDEVKVLRFDAGLLKKGSNVVSLKLAAGGSIMYDVVKLEMDDPGLPKKVPEVGKL